MRLCHPASSDLGYNLEVSRHRLYLGAMDCETLPAFSSRTMIQELEDDISRIDKGIKILQRKNKFRNSWPLRHILKEPLHHGATLNRLIEERALLSRTLYSHTASRFVLQDFPFEIWELIFEYSVPGYSPNNPFDQPRCPNVREAPLSLSHVSRQWRTWVHNMPTLWTRLKIQSSKHAGRMGFILDGAKDWLSRTNQRPLALSIAIVQERQKEADECGLMDFIWGLSPRWQHLQLDIESVETMSKTLNRPMPSLVTLAYVRWQMARPLDPRVSAENALLLKEFYSADRLMNPHNLVLPWSNLTRVWSFYEARVNEVVNFLKIVPNLESCSLRVRPAGADWGVWDVPTTDVYLASLRVLELQSDSPHQLGFVLDHLLLPQLETLRLRVGNIGGECTSIWPREAIYQLAERQAAISQGSMKLSNLELKGLGYGTFTEEDIREVQMKIPSLRLVTLGVWWAGAGNERIFL